jgi:hypothetical protein
MGIEVKWDVRDDETGERHYFLAEKFARQWHFKRRLRRRGTWDRIEPTREMWEELLEALKRRLPRREGVEEADVEQVEKALAALPVPSVLDGPAST